MNSIFKTYMIKPERVDAIKLSKVNIYDAAKWCGGRVDEEAKASDPTDVRVTLNYPTINGVRIAVFDEYLVKDEDGMFHVMKPNVFEGKYVDLSRPRSAFTNRES